MWTGDLVILEKKKCLRKKQVCVFHCNDAPLCNDACCPIFSSFRTPRPNDPDDKDFGKLKPRPMVTYGFWLRHFEGFLTNCYSRQLTFSCFKPLLKRTENTTCPAAFWGLFMFPKIKNRFGQNKLIWDRRWNFRCRQCRVFVVWWGFRRCFWGFSRRKSVFEWCGSDLLSRKSQHIWAYGVGKDKFWSSWTEMQLCDGTFVDPSFKMMHGLPQVEDLTQDGNIDRPVLEPQEGSSWAYSPSVAVRENTCTTRPDTPDQMEHSDLQVEGPELKGQLHAQHDRMVTGHTTVVQWLRSSLRQDSFTSSQRKIWATTMLGSWLPLCCRATLESSVLLMVHTGMVGMVVCAGDKEKDVQSTAFVLNEIGVGGSLVEVAADKEAALMYPV